MSVLVKMSLTAESTRQLRALGVDVDDIWQKAGRTAWLAMRDKALFGFAAFDPDGNRIDPQRIEPTRSIFDYRPAAAT